MAEKFDVIVVGAGPAGTACAYTLAKAGVNVLLLERGEYPGSKNVICGRIYSGQYAVAFSDGLQYRTARRDRS